MRFIRTRDADNSPVLTALDKTVLIRFPKEATWRHQLLGLSLADLLARVFSRIGFENADVSASEHLPPGSPRLIERLEAVRLHGRVTPERPADPKIVVGIGRSEQPADFYVDGYGWQAFIGMAPSRLPEDGGALVAVGPLVAACRGAARTFSIALKDFRPPLPEIVSSYWSGLTYTISDSPFDEPVPAPDVLVGALLGVGSIGGASCYLWSHSPDLRGSLELIDPQTLEVENPDKALLAHKLASEAHLSKVEVARAALAHLGHLDVKAHPEHLREWVSTRDANDPLPLMMCAVDSVEARRELQDSLPLEVINAACNTDEIAVSGHRSGGGPCVYCLHLTQVLDRDRILAKLIASETGIDFMSVVRMLVQDEQLSASLLRRIESNRGLGVGSLALHEGQTIDELYRSAFLYGEARVRLEGGTEAAVPAPFVTALAGFLLAAEGLKAGAGAPLGRFRLGPRGEVGIKVAESPYQDPVNRIISSPPRWPTHECLCRSNRRLRLTAERYGATA